MAYEYKIIRLKHINEINVEINKVEEKLNKLSLEGFDFIPSNPNVYNLGNDVYLIVKPDKQELRRKKLERLNENND